MRNATKGMAPKAFVSVLLASAAILLFCQEVAAKPNPLKNALQQLKAGEFSKVQKLLAGRKNDNTTQDYLLYARSQSAFLNENYRAALRDLKELAKSKGSRFQKWARWRIADTLWEQKRLADAAKEYKTLVAGSRIYGDSGLARYRIAKVAADESDNLEPLKDFVSKYPEHPMAKVARKALRMKLKGPALSNSQIVFAAEKLIKSKSWRDAVRLLAEVKKPTNALQARMDFTLATAFYKMRRHYDRASSLFLRSYPSLGKDSAEALFYAARALSRADHDAEAIGLYLQVVAEFPRSKWAEEASLLAGWLQFNLRDFKKAIPLLRSSRESYGKSKWTTEAIWYEGMSHYLLKNYAEAEPLFARLSTKSGRLVGGQGQYWLAQSQWLQGKKDVAEQNYRKVASDFPFSWYALLANARLEQHGKKPVQPTRRNSPSAPTKAKKPRLTPLIEKADALLRLGLADEASYEMRQGERKLMSKIGRSNALAILFDRYKKAGNFNRPWMLSVVIGGDRALLSPPKGDALFWWKHAYPLAFKKLVEKYRPLGKAPKYYLYTIMRKESGFDPHTHSYADAQGLLQMIPATTKRVAEAVGVTYTDDILFNSDMNIRLGSWYIGRLFHKFRGQVPLAAASYNAGPRAMMDWMTKNPGYEMDVFVELISYNQARNYARRVTETYARYLRLYQNKVYKQPLKVDVDFVENKINY